MKSTSRWNKSAPQMKSLRGKDEIAAAMGGFIQPKTLFSTSSAFGGLHHDSDFIS
jgi:hypothetical protein